MNQVFVYIVGLVVTMGVVFLTLLYFGRPLQDILTDLCGGRERARFWTAFTNVTLFLIPFVLALDHGPATQVNESGIFAIGDEVRSAVYGLIASVIIVGIVLSWHISRARPSKISPGAAPRSGRPAI